VLSVFSRHIWLIEHSQPVLRELGLVSIFWDINFGAVDKVFDHGGQLLDPSIYSPNREIPKRTDLGGEGSPLRA
jgi:hypothetical protein